ncbi:MAG: tyrosine-protein phosphatase [Bacteroidota bacterium]
MNKIFPSYILLLLLLGVMASCADYERQSSPEMTLIEKAALSRTDDKDKLKFYTKYAYLEIYAVNDSLSPGRKVEFSDSNELFMYPGNNHSLFLAAAPKDTFFIAERHIDIEGAKNIRDLGGLFTKDGYQVKWGKLFRSGDISTVSVSDYQRLIPLGINTICDFRTTVEVEEKPDNWPGLDQLSYVNIPVGEGSLMKEELIGKINSPDFDVVKFMVDMNRGFVKDYSAEYRDFIRLLIKEDNYPILYHCTAGKDRTGFASALVLSVLGVSREDIMDEYLMSNYYLHDTSEGMLRKAAIFFGIDHTRLRGLMEVRQDYLRAAFDAIDSNYGSVEAYMTEALQIPSTEIDKLKEILLYDYQSTSQLTSL